MCCACLSDLAGVQQHRTLCRSGVYMLQIEAHVYEFFFFAIATVCAHARTVMLCGSRSRVSLIAYSC